MLRFKVHLENPHHRSIDKAVEALNNGDLIIYPTDTVYGIGCDLHNKKALEAVYRLKAKSKFDPVSVIVQDIKQASQYARISNFAYRVMRHCLPGPYTFILPATREIPKIMLSKRKEVGIRIPVNNVVGALLDAFQRPLVNTSVTMSDEDILIDPDEMETRYNYSVNLMLDAGFLEDPIESTVVSLIDDEIGIIREGKGDIQKVLEK